MRSSKLLAIFLFASTVVFNGCDAKGGGTGGRRGGGGGSRGGGSGGSKSTNPKHTSSPSSSNIGNTNPSNTNSNNNNQPMGPPPAYPGLQYEHVPSFNQPPAYSNFNQKPPAYSPSNNFPPPYSQNFNQRPASSFSSSYKNPSYGSTFGSGGLRGNTYISNNYYGNSRSWSISGYLTKALFYGVGLHQGYLWGSRRWGEEDDRKWRATTKAPYFENKVPGSEIILPAAAVVGAATAFGLVSLLPLNVPINKPLMYCDQNSSDVAQVKILLNGIVYECDNETILMSDFECFNSTSRSEISSELSSNEKDFCDGRILQCGSDDKIHCINATLFSRADIFCNSTTLLNGTSNINETFIILNCYEGQLSEKQAAFIPTTTPSTPSAEKSYSLASRIHIVLLNMIGKGDIIKKSKNSSEKEEEEDRWIPEALTFPPETTATT